MTSALESLTIGVREVDAALAPFRDILGLRVESDTRASVSLLGAWHQPVHAVVRLVELSADGYPFGRIRLVQFSPPPSMTTRCEVDGEAADRPTDTGPKLFDLVVPPPLETTADRLAAAGWRTACVPQPYREGDALFDGASLLGPSEVAVLLKAPQAAANTAMRAKPGSGRIAGVSTVGVVVGDLAASRRFYAEGLDLVVEETQATSADSNAAATCELLGFPKGSPLTMVGVRDRQQSSGRLLLVHVLHGPRRPLRHPMNPGQLGFNLFSLRSADLDAVETRLRGISAEIVTRPTHVAVGEGAPARVMLVRGPDGELLELIEREG